MSDQDLIQEFNDLLKRFHLAGVTVSIGANKRLQQIQIEEGDILYDPRPTAPLTLQGIVDAMNEGLESVCAQRKALAEKAGEDWLALSAKMKSHQQHDSEGQS